jgi:hypothetical protein
MLQTTGNLWDYYGQPKSAIVIPTNIGWKKNQENVMGAGIAKEAAHRFPNLAYRYGRWCEMHGEDTKVVFAEDLSLVLLPTKPLALNAPHLSWRGPSTLARVERSLRELVDIQKEYTALQTVYIPLVGCGNGRLNEADVLPLMMAILTGDCFVIVRERA